MFCACRYIDDVILLKRNVATHVRDCMYRNCVSWALLSQQIKHSQCEHLFTCSIGVSFNTLEEDRGQSEQLIDCHYFLESKPKEASRGETTLSMYQSLAHTLLRTQEMVQAFVFCWSGKGNMPMIYFFTCGPYVHSRTREAESSLDKNKFTVHLIVFVLGLHIIWCNFYSFLLCFRIEMQNIK